MVNLPRPSVFASSAADAVLPKPNPALQIPPSPAESCYYRFGLTTLPQLLQHADSRLGDKLQGVLRQLFSLAQLLSIPSLFGQGDGQAWTFSEQHYPDLLQWKQQHVATLLSQVTELLQKLYASSTTKEIGRDDCALVDLVVGHVTCAVARYLPLSTAGCCSLRITGSEAELVVPQNDGWMSELAQIKAEEVLRGLKEHSSHSHLSDPHVVARALLIDYIKPIFREAVSSSTISSSSVDSDTGRKKPPAAGSTLISHLDANLGQHRFQSAAEDNEAANLAPRRFALAVPWQCLFQTGTQEIVEMGEKVRQSWVDRNEALGCINVLGWCLDTLELDSESEWSSIWPLVVPPLLTLLEHPQPRFRLQGALLVHRLLVRPSSAVDSLDRRKREVVLGKMLIRTGIGSLLERALHVNLTYLHEEEYAPSLVAHSIGALRQLILLTTYPITYIDGMQANNELGVKETLDEPDDCGKVRMDSLLRLVSEAILSTWSYLAIPPWSTRLSRSLVKVTCDAYLTLANDLAVPCATNGETKTMATGALARFLDVTLDWIFRNWLSTITLDHTDQIQTTIHLLHLVNLLLFPSSATHLPVWSIRRFTALIISSVAKCYISALDSPLYTSTTSAHIETQTDTQTRTQVQKLCIQLQECLSRLITNVAQVDTSVSHRWNQMLELDPRLTVLLSTQ